MAVGMSAPPRLPIALRSRLSLANAWRFPLQSRASRRDLWIGGLWLLVPVVGWLLNMGHRIRVVHRLHRGEEPWPAWGNPAELLRHGILTFLGMVLYGAPGVLCVGLSRIAASALHTPTLDLPLLFCGILLFLIAVIAIPGYMSHYCRALDPREIFDPRRALRRVVQGGRAYLHAWAIVLPTMLASFLGLLVFGVGFLWASVWFWQVAAFCFASVFTQRFDLDR
jgi:hypothetical protein